MKKLICAAIVVGSMSAMAAEAPKDAVPVAPAPTAAEAAKSTKPARPTPEQLEKMREQRVKALAERRAEMEAKMLAVIKKYGLDDEKGKALIKDLQDVMMQGRRMTRRPMPVAPKAEKPAAEK